MNFQDSMDEICEYSPKKTRITNKTVRYIVNSFRLKLHHVEAQIKIIDKMSLEQKFGVK